MSKPIRNLAELRTEIDAVDQQLLALLNQRASLANEVGELKRAEGSPVFRPEREAQVINGLQAANPGPLKAGNVATIWREIMSACRALEAPQRVAYLGPAGTFSEEAALGFFGSSIVRVPCASIDEVFHTTSAGAADFGVVPVENSTEGVVARSLDLFLHTPLSIIGETSLFVRHNLLRREPTLDGIQAVLSYQPMITTLDVNMPGMDGFETARLVRGVNSGRDIPLIFYSSNTRNEVYMAEANRIGAVSYLNRSCDADVLCQMVNQILESGRPNLSN